MILSACSIFERTVTEEKVIDLFKEMPVPALGIRIEHDSSYTCYFSRKEWDDSITNNIRDSTARSIYFSALDSLQEANVIIERGDLPDNLSLRLVDDLFRCGHVYVRYQDGDHVSKLTHIKKTSRKLDQEYFIDEKKNKTLRYYSLLKKGSF